MDLIFPHNFLPCISMYHIHFHLLDGTCCFTTSGSGNETCIPCIPELTLTQAGPAHSSPSAFFGGARGQKSSKDSAYKKLRPRWPRSGTRLRLYRHYPCSCGGSQHEQGIYEYYEYTRIYIDSMADYWQVFLVALAVELFRKSLLALRYLRETLQKKTLAFTF